MVNKAYAEEFVRNYYGFGGSAMYKFDPMDNWSITLVGDTGLTGGINTADFSPDNKLHIEVQSLGFNSNGELFGISSTYTGHEYNVLIEIDTNTEVGSHVCDLYVPDLNCFDIDAYDQFRTITSGSGCVYLINPDDCTINGYEGSSRGFEAMTSIIKRVGDYDQDGDVDLKDFGGFQRSFTGPILPIRCYDDSDCGEDGFVGEPFCVGK